MIKNSLKNEVLNMKQTLKAALAVVSISLLVPAQAAQTASNFEALVNDRSTIGDVLRLSHDDGPLFQGSPLDSGFYSSRRTTDCRKVRFAANGATLSQPVRLESRFYRERCSRDSEGNRRCEEQYVGSERRTVTIRVEKRGRMLPWEEDVFNVCLSGTQLDVKAVEASHQYRFGMPDMREDLIVATAGDKLPTNPDPAGIRLEAFSTGSQSFSAAFSDQWASYYAGEDIVLSLEIRQNKRFWSDETVLRKDVRISAQDSYSIALAMTEFMKRPESGQKYFLKWSFQRLGRISKPTWMGEWQTIAVDLGQSTSALKD